MGKKCLYIVDTSCLGIPLATKRAFKRSIEQLGKYFTVYTQQQPTIVIPEGWVTKDQVAFRDRVDISASIADFQPGMDIASWIDLGTTVEFKDVVKAWTGEVR